MSITNAYVGYKTFVFKTQGDYLKEYTRFYLVYGVVFLLNLALLPIIVELGQVSPVVGQALVIVLNAAISYTGHKYFSFSKER